MPRNIRPFCEALFDTVDYNPPIVSSVSVVLSRRSEPAILGAVIPIGVNPVYLHRRWDVSPVLKKTLKLLPFGAHPNAAASVKRPPFRAWILTPIKHETPNPVRSCFGKPVSSVSFGCAFTSKTTTTFSVSSEREESDYFYRSAIASNPKSPLEVSAWNSDLIDFFDDYKSIKSVAWGYFSHTALKDAAAFRCFECSTQKREHAGTDGKSLIVRRALKAIREYQPIRDLASRSMSEFWEAVR